VISPGGFETTALLVTYSQQRVERTDYATRQVVARGVADIALGGDPERISERVMQATTRKPTPFSDWANNEAGSSHITEREALQENYATVSRATEQLTGGLARWTGNYRRRIIRGGNYVRVFRVESTEDESLIFKATRALSLISSVRETEDRLGPLVAGRGVAHFEQPHAVRYLGGHVVTTPIPGKGFRNLSSQEIWAIERSTLAAAAHTICELSGRRVALDLVGQNAHVALGEEQSIGFFDATLAKATASTKEIFDQNMADFCRLLGRAGIFAPEWQKTRRADGGRYLLDRLAQADPACAPYTQPEVVKAPFAFKP
jgi:hypothetical protein